MVLATKITMGNETELKFEVAPQDLRKLKSVRALHQGAPKEENLVSVYFDTPKHKLAGNGVSLRVRHNGKKRLQTIKAEGLGGSFRRGEWQHEIKADTPNLQKAHGTPLAPLLSKKLKRKLKPIFKTRVHRISIPIRKNRSRIEVALDSGQICAGRQSAPISELELELKRGRADDVFKLARKLTRLVPAKLSLKSKAERGYGLIDDAPVQAVRAEKIKLRRGISTAGAFRIIGRSILRQMTANESAVERMEPEGVHQMRVGLRRLRAAISLSSKLFGDEQTERIKSEFKWLTGELAPARDLDVYERGKVEPLRRAAPREPGMKELEAALTSRRATAFGRAKIAVDSQRYRSLLLDTLQWLEIGNWARRSRRYGVRPIEWFAADILARRTKKAIKKAKRLRQLVSRQRHKLRIAIKKLRYATDFFEFLFASRKAKKHLSRFKVRLEDLQDRLGALNDIEVHQKLAPKIAAGKAHTNGRARAFAAGIVSGREQSEIEPLLREAESDARKFAHIRPFWT
jgi:inorganic triphosphatase YgiF